MRELVRTNDPVRISWLTAALRAAAIEAVVLDTHTAIMEGSISAIQRRIMVPDEDFDRATRLLAEADPQEGQAGASDVGTGLAGADVTIDAVLGGRLHVRQPAAGYRAAIDPVLLAAAVPARAGERVLDVGCGVGTAGLCLAVRVPGVRVSGIDLQRDLVALATTNARDNGLADRVEFMAGDLLHPPPRLAAGTFDHLMANPPFVPAGRGNPPADPGRALAAVEGEARLADWMRFCLTMVRRGGSITLVHRADRLDEVLALMRLGVGGLTILPLWPGGGKPAKRILVAGRKGSAAPLSLLPGVVLHQGDGRYTEAADRVLRDAAALPLE